MPSAVQEMVTVVVQSIKEAGLENTELNTMNGIPRKGDTQINHDILIQRF